LGAFYLHPSFLLKCSGEGIEQSADHTVKDTVPLRLLTGKLLVSRCGIEFTRMWGLDTDIFLKVKFPIFTIAIARTARAVANL
jgi:hypothetical protein